MIDDYMRRYQVGAYEENKNVRPLRPSYSLTKKKLEILYYQQLITIQSTKPLFLLFFLFAPALATLSSLYISSRDVIRVTYVFMFLRPGRGGIAFCPWDSPIPPLFTILVLPLSTIHLPPLSYHIIPYQHFYIPPPARSSNCWSYIILLGLVYNSF